MSRLWWLCAVLALAACAPTRVARESPPADAQAGERLMSTRESQLFERSAFDLICRGRGTPKKISGKIRTFHANSSVRDGQAE